LTASLSEGAKAQPVTQTIRNASGVAKKLLVLQFSSEVPGDALTVEYALTGDDWGNAIFLQAAALCLTDTQPPSAVTNLEVTPYNNTNLLVTWEPASDDHGVAGYRVYLNGELTETVTAPNTTCYLQGVAPNQDCEVAVVAFDRAGNRSPKTSKTVAIGGSSEGPLGPNSPYAAVDDSLQTEDSVTFRFGTYKSGAADHFEILDESGSALLKTQDGTEGSCTVTGLAAGEIRTLRIRAYTAAGRYEEITLKVGLAAAQYTVELYAGGALYRTESRTDLIGKTVKEEPIAIDGYVYDAEASAAQGAVAADGSLVLKLYYKPISKPSGGADGQKYWPDRTEEGAKDSVYKMVVCRRLHVRSAAAATSSALGMLTRGTLVKGRSLGNGWFAFEYDGRTAYLCEQYLQALPGYSAAEKQTYTVACRLLNVRTGPSTQCEKAGALRRGETLTGCDLGNGWVLFRSGDDVRYVSRRYLAE
ncbi:MAG: SH3 domain-containing protein, partial [Candidatus Spyradocola sp.]